MQNIGKMERNEAFIIILVFQRWTQNGEKSKLLWGKMYFCNWRERKQDSSMNKAHKMKIRKTYDPLWSNYVYRYSLQMANKTYEELRVVSRAGWLN